MNNMSKNTVSSNKGNDKEEGLEIPPKMNYRQAEIFYYFRKAAIWAVFFVFLFLLRDLFGLVFMTFILGFIMFRITEYIGRKVKISRKKILTGLYVILISLVTGMMFFITPKVINEAKEFNSNIPEMEAKVRLAIENIKTNNPGLNQVFNLITTKEQLYEYTSKLRNDIINKIKTFLTMTFHVIVTIILSIVFSFIILLDFTQVVHDLKKFQSTKLRSLYNDIAHPIVRFFQIVGLAFEAQTVIAFVNTGLTVLGMFILGIQKTAFLGIIVFLCSFIPVLGVFISSLPIVLVAFNTGGFHTTFLVVIMILVIHAIEAYVLNPRIYAQHMKINPVFVLIILFLGHHLFGIWGMLLGVPVIYFFMTYISGLKSKLELE